MSLGVSNFTLGIPRKYFFENVDQQILLAVEQAIEQLTALGCTLRELDLPINEDRTVFLFESHAYHRDKIASSPELYDPETLRRIRVGEEITESEYRSALLELQTTRQDILEKIREVDVVLTPTTPIPAPRISDLTEDISRLRPAEIVLLRNTRPMNVWGLPAISVPCGSTSEGLPIGLQIAGVQGEEGKVLRAARAFDRVTRSN
jgi:Asp-tRNA(Asn)/Glu-tRNA(Gln) amidotransferase A subunit family amidase